MNIYAKNIIANFFKVFLLFWCFLSLFCWAADQYIDADDVFEEEEVVVVKKSTPPPVVILNQQSQGQVQKKQIYSQPSVRVDGIPIEKSQAIQLQQSRQEAEIQTEQKILEKLEGTRLRDEQERFKQLFKNPANKKKAIIAQNGVKNIQGNLYRQIPTNEYKDRVYVGVIGGQITNLGQQVLNLRSYGSFGVSLGAHDESGLIMEGAFYYSTHWLSPNTNVFQNNIFQQNNFLGGFNNVGGFNNLGGFNTIGDAFFSTIRQLTGALSLKYTPFSNRFKPHAGVSIAYNLWLYQHNNNFSVNAIGFNCHLGYQFCANGFYKTNSIDLGVTVGVDLSLNKKVDIGFNVLANVLNLYNNHTSVYANYYRNSAFFGVNGLIGATNPITLEESNWMIASINVKLFF